MLARKQINRTELLYFIFLVGVHVIYTLFVNNPILTQQVLLYAVGTTLLAAFCVKLIKNHLWAQIAYSFCIVLAVHLIGKEMGTLAYGVVIYMVSGAVISLYGDCKLNRYYIIVVNLSIIFGLIVEYGLITYMIQIRYYLLLVVFCEACLLVEYRVVMRYQQKVEEFEIQNALLSIAQKSQGEFLANMSHEIRTPMNAIIGMSELILREEEQNERIREYCYNIQSSGENLVRIINDILDFSKIESGKMEIVSEPYSMADIVQDVVNTVMFRRGEKDISVIVDFDPDMPRLLCGDEVRNRQIFTNIVTNAVKYTDRGFIYIYVSCYKKGEENWLMIQVRDSGIGIRKEDMAKLFESFCRMDTKRNRSVEGTGLGLPICKRLVEEMHGTIKVESEYGKGTCVKIDIPQKIQDEAPVLRLKKQRENVHLAFYGEREQQNTDREIYYRAANEHLWTKLGISSKAIGGFEALMDELEKGELTHLFVDGSDYVDQRNFFDQIGKKVKVYVMFDPQFPIELGKSVHGVRMPFSSISIISALNGETFYNRQWDKKNEQLLSAENVKILVVDDNELNLKVADGILKLFDVTCVLAKSGREALEILRAKDIDLVFMDHMMPEMDGVETTKMIRRYGGEYAKNLPIIAMTANVLNGAKQMFYDNGFQDFLPKPMNIKMVEKILERWVPEIAYAKQASDEKKAIAEQSGGIVRVQPNNTVIGSGNVSLTDTAGNVGSVPQESTVGNVSSVPQESTADNVSGASQADSAGNVDSVSQESTADNVGGEPQEDSAGNVDEASQAGAEQTEGHTMQLAVSSAATQLRSGEPSYMEINDKLALENMGGMWDFYIELLEYSIEMKQQRKDEIIECFEQKDWKEYQIQVHGLKGAMRSLGIEEMAKIAQAQEFACKESRIEDAIAGHEHFLVEYERAHQSIEHYLKEVKEHGQPS